MNKEQAFILGRRTGKQLHARAIVDTTQYYKVGDEEIARYEMGVIETADDLHNFLTGAHHETTQQHVDRLAGFLAARLQDWHPNTTEWTADWDQTVKQMVEVVLREYREGPHCYRKEPT